MLATLCAVKPTSLDKRTARSVPAVAGALLAGAVLTGCAAGFGATSAQSYAPADGVQAESGDLRALNVLVVADEGATAGVLVMTVANDGARDDRLTAVETSGGRVALSGPVDLPAGSATAFGNDTEASATVTGLTADPGETIEVTLSFARATPITLRTVVVPAAGDYAGITPSAPSS